MRSGPSIGCLHFFKVFGTCILTPKNVSSTLYDSILLGIIRIIFVGDFEDCWEDFVVLGNNVTGTLCDVLGYKDNTNVGSVH
jgi:hypothetical protein